MVGPWTSTLGNLVLLFATLDLKHDCKTTGKNPRWLPVRYVYALHQIWSSVKWRFMTCFFVCLFSKTIWSRGLGKWMVSIFFFFFLSSFGAVPTARIRAREGSYSDWLAPAVSEKVWCNHREKDTLKRMQCVCDICFYLTHFFPDAGPCSFLAPHNLVLQLPKLMRVGLCCPS